MSAPRTQAGTLLAAIVVLLLADIALARVQGTAARIGVLGVVAAMLVLVALLARIARR